MDPFTTLVVHVGFNAFIGSLQTIKETTTNINTILRRFDHKTSNRMLLDILMESDIEATMDVVQELLKRLILLRSSSDDLRMIIAHLERTVKDIERELIVIHEKDNYNRQLWLLYYFRAYQFDHHIHRIRVLKNILNQRLDMLIKVLQIHQILPATAGASAAASEVVSDDWSIVRQV